jgi:hypothetical protein
MISRKAKDDLHDVEDNTTFPLERTRAIRRDRERCSMAYQLVCGLGPFSLPFALSALDLRCFVETPFTVCLLLNQDFIFAHKLTEGDLPFSSAPDQY